MLGNPTRSLGKLFHGLPVSTVSLTTGSESLLPAAALLSWLETDDDPCVWMRMRSRSKVALGSVYNAGKEQLNISDVETRPE